MEEKSSPWVFTLLSTRKEVIPIVDTIVFHEGKPYKYLSNKLNSEIHETSAKPLQSIFSQLSSLDCPASKVICCFFYNSSCKYIKKGEIRSTVSKHSNTLEQIQIFNTKKSLNLSSGIILDILYLKNRYKSQVYLKTSGLEKLENPFLKSAVNELGSIIVKAIESEQTSQLLKLNLEFLTDSNENLYLHKVNSCTLVSSFWAKEVCGKSPQDLTTYLKSCKKVRTKCLFERDPEISFTKDISVISIDSSEKEEKEEKDDGLLKVPDLGYTKSSKTSPLEHRNTRRTLSNCFKGSETLKSKRKATFVPRAELNIKLLSHNDLELDDSWDYGTVDVNFLEMISRRAIRNSDILRPISPSYEEIKQKMRQINEKFSLTPCSALSLNLRSDSIRFAGDELRKSIESRNEKISALGSPCLARRKNISKSSVTLPRLEKIHFNVGKSCGKV